MCAQNNINYSFLKIYDKWIKSTNMKMNFSKTHILRINVFP